MRQVSLQSATAFFFITKCDGLLLQSATAFYYKVRQVLFQRTKVLQNVTILLQSATGITKSEDYYKVRQYTVARLLTRYSSR